MRVTEAMKEARAEEIAEKLNDTDKWNSHGRGIPMQVLRDDLNLEIEDSGADEKKNEAIRTYNRLRGDYMNKLDCRGIVHMPGQYIPTTGGD